MPHRVEREIGGRVLSIESGRLGKQAGGSVVVRHGDTMVFVAAVGGGESSLSFFPLTVDYREKTYAAGKIPGGFFKREGRPTTKEVLTARLIDRPIRPLFPDGYRCEVSVSAIVLSADKENDPDILAMIGASAALSISDVPFQGPTGSVRMGMLPDGVLIVNPTHAQIEGGLLDLVVSGTRDAITTVECGAHELSEAQMLEALRAGQDVVGEVIGMVEELVAACGKAKPPMEPVETHEELYGELRQRFAGAFKDTIQTQGKLHRKRAEQELVDAIMGEYCPEGEESPERPADVVKAVVGRLQRDVERELIAGGRRADGRAYDAIRSITCEVGFLPRTHGSGLFTRGETQALCVVTLGTELDEQRIDGLKDEYTERLLVHYDFPSFSVGETWPNRGPRRREIGHGNLARRAIQPVVPIDDAFPYTIRVTSDILESNGSSSMATVCGASLALMDAGVPMKAAVAGIAMGMVKVHENVYILSDIQGSEDHNGDLDFKVAGSVTGITALQLDCKVKGIGFDVLARALEQARAGRMQILETMHQVMSGPRDHHSPYAPRVERFPINPEKIGLVIGPSGKTIRRIQEETGTTIAVADEGRVSIWGPTQEATMRARTMVEALVEEAQIGKIYKGKVTSIKDFGCFVEIIPGQDGLVHVSEMADGYVEHASDHVKIGDEVTVKCIDVTDDGRIKLSIRALNEEEGARSEHGEGGGAQDGGRGRPPRGPRPGGGGRPHGGREGGREGGRRRGARDDRRR